LATIRERVRRDGKPIYNVQVRVAGYTSQTRSFTSKSEARKWAKVEEAKIIEGRAFRGAEAHRRTLCEAVDQYVTEKMPTLRSQNMHSSALAWWKARLGTRKLVDITAAVIVRERAALLRERYVRANPDSKRTTLEEGEAPREFARTAATANRYVAVLSSLLSATRREWHWIAHNPCEEIERLPERPNRARVLTPAERKALLAETAPDPVLHLFVQMALHTVCRAGELLKLKWADVDLDAGQVIYRDTKNEQPRSAWLHGDVKRLLEEHAKREHKPEDALFQNASLRGRYQYADKFQETCTAAGLGKFHFHNLRHTAATVLAQQGASEQQLKAVGGWKSGIVSRYIHIAAADTKAITKKLSKQL
jgi:integrase